MDKYTVEVKLCDDPEDLKSNIVIFQQKNIYSILNDETVLIESAKDFAVKNETYVVPGFYVKDGFLKSCIIDDKGKIKGEQSAVHLGKFFRNLKRGIDINIIETPFAKVFLGVDIDIYKPEVIRTAAMLGAELIISMQYISEEDFCESMIMSGAWQEAQQNCIYIVNTSNIESFIIGPCETTLDLSGIIGKSKDSSIYCELDKKSRNKAYNKFPVFDSFNIDFYNKNIELLTE